MTKLKPDRSVTGLIPAAVSLCLFGATLAVFGRDAAFRVLALFFFLYAVFSFACYARTRNQSYLVGGVYMIFAGLAAATFPETFRTKDARLTYLFQLGVVFFGLWLVYLTVNRRAKWRGREILELAAAPVTEIGNGYTGRPLAAGRVEFSKREILAFADFAARNLIALPYVQPDRVLFVPVLMSREFAYLLGLRPDPTQGSWVSIGFDGQVSVNISQEDYLNYQEDWAFDQLCASLGNLFVEFLDLFRKGQGVRVIDRLDALRLGVLS